MTGWQCGQLGSGDVSVQVSAEENDAEYAILNDEFEYVHQYNPIEHIKSRLKEPESIVKKLKRHGYDSTLENMVKYVKDIAACESSALLPRIFTAWQI